jgi:aryl-alcohol dehydrogenase-like predicted oxidoreductase
MYIRGMITGEDLYEEDARKGWFNVVRALGPDALLRILKETTDFFQSPRNKTDHKSTNIYISPRPLIMERIRIGPFVVSPVCLGTMSFVGAGGMSSTDEDLAIAVIHQAIREGINFFDTAEAYNDHAADRILGKALRQAFDTGLTTRDAVVVAGKFGTHKGDESVAYSGEMIEATLAKSLEALGMDYLDLYQVHWSANMKSVKETVATLEKLQAEGKIKAYGVCNFGTKSLLKFLECGGRPITNQLPYNLLWRAIEFEILPLCREKGIGVLTYSSLQQGLLTGKFTTAAQIPEGRRRTRHFPESSTPLSRHGQAGCEALTFQTLQQIKAVSGDNSMSATAVQWLQSQPGVTSVLIGASKASQVTSNVMASQNRKYLGQEKCKQLSEGTFALKDALGPNPDMWAKSSRYE